MRLTTKGRYAVMAMADITIIASRSEPISLYQISDRLGIKLNYLEQIFLKLKKSELVESIKGPGGGYFLARDADAIKIIDIVNAVDEPIKMTRCTSKQGGCSIKGATCITHHLWNGLGNQIFSYLNSITLKDLCSDNKQKFYG
jgi:Rrf2 family iron-sulfur cluster assembly transcriptional regulator